MSPPTPLEGPRSRLVDEGYAALLGDSPALRETLHGAEVAASASAPVLLRGEAGSGVDAFARLVHALSPRAQHPFVALACATDAAGDALLDAFTRANGGTLFLDDVHALSTASQTLLLRLLADASQHPTAPGARVVVGTHEDPREAAQRGAFREDLLVRLAELTLAIPPLRERAEDVPALAAHFAARSSQQLGRSVTLPRATLQALRSHRWPRNLPELQEMVERLVATTDPEPATASNAEYRVPVRRDVVTLTLADGGERHGTLFSPLDQKLDDLFARAERFLPVEHEGRVRLYALDAIACVTAPSPADDAREPCAVALPVRVRLRSGASLEGELRYVPTGARGRAVDFLNGDARGFALYARDVTHFIAKAHVEHVEELG